jgi:hypothetical protein
MVEKPTPVSRRTVLGFPLGAAVLSLPAQAGPRAKNPDSELLRLCAEHEAAHQESDRLTKRTRGCTMEEEELFEPEMNANTLRIDAAAKQIVVTAALTLDGARAKAAVLRREISDANNMEAENTDPRTLLAWSLAHDVLALEVRT